MNATSHTRSAKSARRVTWTQFAGGIAAAVCVSLLIGLIARSSLPVLTLLIVTILGLVVRRSGQAPAYVLLSIAPLQSMGLRHMSLSLIDVVLLLSFLDAAIAIVRGARVRGVLAWPSGWFGFAVGAFLVLTTASGVVPAVGLARGFLAERLESGILSIAQAIFSGTTNPLSEIWHHMALALLLLLLTPRSLPSVRPQGLARIVGPAAAILGVGAIIERAVGIHWGYRVLVGVVGLSFPSGRIPGPFIWPTQFATYLDMILPIALALAVVRGGKGNRGAGWTAFAVALGIIALFLTMTRSGWSGLLLSTGAVIALGLRAGESRRRLATATVILSFLLVPLTFEMLRMRADVQGRPGTRPEDGGRTEYVWPTAIRMIQAHPLLGCGLGMWRTVSPEFAPYPLGEGRSERVHAHNIFLQVASESGVPAALVLLLIILLAGRELWRRSRGCDPLWIGLAAAYPGYLWHGMFEDTLFPPELFFCFWVFVALATAGNRGGETVAPSDSPVLGSEADRAAFGRLKRIARP